MHEPPTPILPWLPWPGRGWPASIQQESAFVKDLTRVVATLDVKSSPPSVKRRGSYTAVLNALRGGASVGDIRGLASGMDLGALLVAYHDIHTRLESATTAWEDLMELHENPAVTDIVLAEATYELSPRFGMVLATPVARLTDTSLRYEPATIRMLLQSTRYAVEIATDRARSLERELSSLGAVPYRDARAVEIGRSLYNPYAPSAYTNPHYIPDRVAAIDAPRARALLRDVIFVEE